MSRGKGQQAPRDYPLNDAEGLPLYFRDHQDAAGNPAPAMPSGGLRIEGEQAMALGPTLLHVGE
ncbi:protein of unknown function [Candidatus Promineifilum breve]|uniref:Uncharacterized protein n=1 Tax=Candidatus Promineifilum breve TaxID=1806508 RepID=A0A160T8W0_9CHLR|nr:hypothetical protein [Candidatus Promineifilum breve]CUS06209.1 protein of unknown function [Candidatus Promineifilum breve]